MPERPKPVPVPDEWSQGYWEAARDGRLVVQRCDDCGHAQYPPEVICAKCQSANLGYADASGQATMYSFGVFPRSLMPVFEAPYAVALVDLDDHPGVRMMTNIVDADLSTLEIGMPLEVVFEPRGAWQVPQFRPMVEGVR